MLEPCYCSKVFEVGSNGAIEDMVGTLQLFWIVLVQWSMTAEILCCSRRRRSMLFMLRLFPHMACVIVTEELNKTYF